MMSKAYLYLAAMGISAVGASAATAAPLCTDGSFSAAADFVCTYDGLKGNTNDSLANVAAAYLAATGSTKALTLYGKSDQEDADDLFTFSGGTLVMDGKYDFSVKTTGFDVLDDDLLFEIVTVKAANEFNLFYFASGVNSGTVYSDILNNGGQVANISHISFWNPFEAPDLPPPNEQVPAPAALGLLGLGLASLAATRRRRYRG